LRPLAAQGGSTRLQPGINVPSESGFTGCGKMLYGREDVSEHGFIRAAKLSKMNDSALPKASAQRSAII